MTRTHRTPILSSLYHAVMIIISCAACILPVELFLSEIWPRRGFLILLLLLLGGSLLALSLPRQYYRIKSFEVNGNVYERIGIRFFKRFVPDGDYINRIAKRSAPGYRVVSDENSILRVETGTRWAETFHLGWLALTLPPTIYALMLGWNKFALLLFLPNILLHLYLVLLQRYTRARIQNVLLRRRNKR